MNITENYLNFNQTQFFSYAEEKWISEKRNEIKSQFEAIDAQIRAADWRKADGWKANGYVQRTIITVFGPVTFSRTKYFKLSSKQTKKIKYLADSFLQIEKYQRVSYDLKTKIIKESVDAKRQKDILAVFKYCELTTSTVSHIIRNYIKEDTNRLIKKVKANQKIDLINEKYLYLEFDDSFATFRQNKVCNKWQIRLLAAHTGRRLVSKNRYELLNKRVFVKYRKLSSPLISTEIYIDDVIMWLSNNYDNLDKVKIIVCGDGASWIKNIAGYLNAGYVLDKFHIIKSIKLVFPRKTKGNGNSTTANNQIVKKCVNLLESGSSDMLLKLLKELLNNNYFENPVKLKDLINYIKNNKEGIDSYREQWFIGCRAEAQVSHIIKSMFGYGAKIYNIKTFMNFMFIKMGKINDFDFVELKNELFNTENFHTRGSIRGRHNKVMIRDIKKPSDFTGIYKYNALIPHFKHFKKN